MVHRSMGNDLRVVDEVYVMRGCLCWMISFSSLFTRSLV